mmetsp:Transcript_46531/g.108488  ORF Transcript_46531/g.108488 Transcript_46531/m.108488 type:complete len:831 (-) Transcript_46531:13-2505(-)
MEVTDFNDDEVLFTAVENLVEAAAKAVRVGQPRKAEATLGRAQNLAVASIKAGALVGFIARAAISIQRSAHFSRSGSHREALSQAIAAGTDSEEVWRAWLAWHKAGMSQPATTDSTPRKSRPSTAVGTRGKPRHLAAAPRKDLPSWVERAVCVTIQAKHNIALELEYLEYEEVSSTDLNLQESCETILSCKDLIMELHRHSALLAESLLPADHHVRQLAEQAEAAAVMRLEEVHRGIAEWAEHTHEEETTMSSTRPANYVDPGHFILSPGERSAAGQATTATTATTGLTTLSGRIRPSSSPANMSSQRKNVKPGIGTRASKPQDDAEAPAHEELIRLPLEQRKLLAEVTLGDRSAGRHAHAQKPATGKLFAQPAMMKAPSDYYSFLGIPNDTEDPEVIHAARDRMEKLVDPEVLGNGAANLQDVVKNAVEILTDKEQRQKYDNLSDRVCVNARTTRARQRLSDQRLSLNGRPSSAPSKGKTSRPRSAQTPPVRPDSAQCARPASPSQRRFGSGQGLSRPDSGIVQVPRPTSPSRRPPASENEGQGKRALARRDPLKPDEDWNMQRDLFEDWLRENGGLDRKKLFYNQLASFEGMRVLQEDFRRKSKIFRQLYLKEVSAEDLHSNRVHFSAWGIQVREMMERKKRSGSPNSNKLQQSPVRRSLNAAPAPLLSPEATCSEGKRSSPTVTRTQTMTTSAPSRPSSPRSLHATSGGIASPMASPSQAAPRPTKSGKGTSSYGKDLREMAKQLKRSANSACQAVQGDARQARFSRKLSQSMPRAEVLAALAETPDDTPRLAYAAHGSFLQSLALNIGRPGKQPEGSVDQASFKPE